MIEDNLLVNNDLNLPIEDSKSMVFATSMERDYAYSKDVLLPKVVDEIRITSNTRSTKEKRLVVIADLANKVVAINGTDTSFFMDNPAKPVVDNINRKFTCFSYP